MLIRPISDIHLEFSNYRVPKMETDSETILVLAGDISLPHKPSCDETFKAFIQDVAARFRGVILIEGNHEHYSGNFPRTYDMVEELLQEYIPTHKGVNVHHLANRTVVIDDVAFIGATLWTDCNRDPHAAYLWGGMADARLIRTGPKNEPHARKFAAIDSVKEFDNSKKYILDEIVECKDMGYKTVVVVHHGVSSKSCHEMYAGDSMNMFFYSEMTIDFMEANPNLIIHGHTHMPFDYKLDDTDQICQTRVVVNPRGYPGENNNGFDPLKIVEV